MLLRGRFYFNIHPKYSRRLGVSPNSHREWSGPFALRRRKSFDAATAHTAKGIAFVQGEKERKRKLPCYNPMYSYPCYNPMYSYLLVVHNSLNKECLLWS